MEFRIFSLPLCALGLLVSQEAAAVITNGDFEQWEGNSPVGWTTIDSGISVAPSADEVSSGESSARIVVNTGTQSKTDFLQSVRVEQGKSYDFSVSVFHTEGGTRARLYADGYRNYSIPSKTNQWQDITFRYDAPSSKNIMVGLRFYDVSGFDGSEVVYLDSFRSTETNPTPPPGNSCEKTTATLTLITDSSASETSWLVKNSSNQELYNGSGYASNTTNTKAMCLEDGDYTFVINDSHGDGICCSSGDGSFKIEVDGNTLISGGEFQLSQPLAFKIGDSDTTTPVDPPLIGEYYKAAEGKTGFALKTALYNIIRDHNSQGYGNIWNLIKIADIDRYYENDGTILDVYSEKPSDTDSVSFTKETDQCGQYRKEGDCYNREHSFPKSWFGGKSEPMNSDGHHLFATDGYVNSKRGNWPFGEVGIATYTSSNGSKLGPARPGLGYSGTVFEPIDEFKGDFARAYFYMATRYENAIATWEGNSESSNATLDGTNTTVFEPWHLAMLKRWHKADPVSQKEIDRNEALYEFQGNRNPFIDHPEFVTAIWGE